MNATIKIDMDTITRKRGNNREMAEAVMAATRAAMLSEHAGYYARHRRDGEGYSHFADGSFQWETSAGNTLKIERDGDDPEILVLNVSGFRHGIPWRFFGMGCEFCGFAPLDLLEDSAWEAESQEPDLAPWLTVGDRRAQDWRWLRRAGDRGVALVCLTDPVLDDCESKHPGAEYWDAYAVEAGEIDTRGYRVIVEHFPISRIGWLRLMEADSVERVDGVVVK